MTTYYHKNDIPSLLTVRSGPYDLWVWSTVCTRVFRVVHTETKRWKIFEHVRRWRIGILNFYQNKKYVACPCPNMEFFTHRWFPFSEFFLPLLNNLSIIHLAGKLCLYVLSRLPYLKQFYRKNLFLFYPCANWIGDNPRL